MMAMRRLVVAFRSSANRITSDTKIRRSPRLTDQTPPDAMGMVKSCCAMRSDATTAPKPPGSTSMASAL